MFLSESEDELEQLQSDSDSESENSHCSLDEDYIPRALALGSDQWVQAPWVGFSPTKYPALKLDMMCRVWQGSYES